MGAWGCNPCSEMDLRAPYRRWWGQPRSWWEGGEEPCLLCRGENGFRVWESIWVRWRQRWGSMLLSCVGRHISETERSDFTRSRECWCMFVWRGSCGHQLLFITLAPRAARKADQVVTCWTPCWEVRKDTSSLCWVTGFGLHTNHLFSRRKCSGEADADFPNSLLLVVTSPLWSVGKDGEVTERCIWWVFAATSPLLKNTSLSLSYF